MFACVGAVEFGLQVTLSGKQYENNILDFCSLEQKIGGLEQKY